MTEYKRNPMEICKEFKDALCHFNLQMLRQYKVL